jgi:hypothetical protein
VAVSVQEWSAYFAQLLGTELCLVVEPVPSTSIGSVGDDHKRASITGPCRVDWRLGFRDMAGRYFSDRVKAL